MKTGPNGIALIKSFEQCRLAAFKPIPTDPWTIGWGRAYGVIEGQTCTQQQADEWLAQDLLNSEYAIKLLVKVPLTQNQFDALVSFVYNVGADIDTDDIAEGLGDSTLLKFLNNRQYVEAGSQFQRWVKAKGVTLAGLVRRREAERRLFLTPDGQGFEP